MGETGAADSIRIIFGLGNPGLAYRHNRHNAGFLFLDRLLSQPDHRLIGRERGTRAVLERVELWGRPVLLVRPQTYMNLSGEAYVRVLADEAVLPQQTLIVYDDLALPLGRLRIRQRGSAGGHRGMASIIERSGTAEIPRLRLGIGPAESPADTIAWVLSDFSPAEREVLARVFDRSVEALRTILSDGILRAMSSHNQAGEVAREVEPDETP